MNIGSKFKKEIGLIGISRFKILNKSKILLIGLGGVGGFVFEGLIRAGISNFILVDKDKFDETNINRQLESYTTNIGKSKVDEYKNRALKINPESNIITYQTTLNTQNTKSFLSSIDNDMTFVIDCIDDINVKIELIKYFYDNNINFISSMGAANHLNSNNIKIDNLNRTRYCPLAKKIRKEIKKYGNYNPKVIFIDEEIQNIKDNSISDNGISTISYIPAIVGLKIAEYVIKSI